MRSLLSGLLEREGERAALTRAFTAVLAGEGAAVIIRGPVGIGKTELLRTGLADARASGLRTHLARASEYEGDLALGVARQLFEPALARFDEDEREVLFSGPAARAREALDPTGAGLVDPRDASFAVLHGLYWLCVNLADHGPLVLAVDDLPWADIASQRWIAYLAQRIDALPVLLLVTVRTEGEESRTLEELLTAPAASALVPAPFSVRATRVVVEELLGPGAADGFVAACHAATRGNPLFLRELLAGLRERGVQPVEGEAASVNEVGPRAVTRLLRRRLRALGADAEQLAQAAAILGDGADTLLVRDLAALEPAAFDAAARLVEGADLLAIEPEVAFTHPITRAAINVALSAERRASLSAGAARLLTQRGELEAVGGHLLGVPPAADTEVVATLRYVAARAFSRGAPEVAVSLLFRALCEPPPFEDEPDVLHELARAELAIQASIAPVHLRAALDRTPPGPARAGRAADLARALHNVHRSHDALQVAEDELARCDGPGRDRLVARIVELAQFLPERQAIDRRTAAAAAAIVDPVMAARVRGVRAYDAMVTGEHAAAVLLLAREALVGGALATDTSEGSMPVFLACIALAAAGEGEAALRELNYALETARRRGSIVSYAGALSIRARLRLAQGDLVGTEADALEIRELGDDGLGRDYSTAWLVESLTEQGRLEAADAVVRGGVLGGTVPGLTALNPGLHARGRLRIAEGRVEEGLRDVLECGVRQERVGSVNPADLPWRGTAALAQRALGRREEAERLSVEHLVLAEAFGAPATLGAALRVRGEVLGGSVGRELLERAVDLLAGATDPLERCRALLAVGACRQEAGQLEAARRAFAVARELAQERGAKPLEKAAMQALLAAGGRPRRVRASGHEAMTAAERRTAEQVAQGLTNRETAQALFVTEKTVEGHLRNVFRKLGISSRTQLADVLDGPAVAAPDA